MIDPKYFGPTDSQEEMTAENALLGRFVPAVKHEIWGGSGVVRVINAFDAGIMELSR